MMPFQTLAKLRLIVVEDRAEAAVLGEQPVAAPVVKVQVVDGDGLRRLTGCERQRFGCTFSAGLVPVGTRLAS